MLDDLLNYARAEGVPIDDDYEEAVYSLSKQVSYEKKKVALFIYHSLRERESTRKIAQLKEHFFREIVKYL